MKSERPVRPLPRPAKIVQAVQTAVLKASVGYRVDTAEDRFCPRRSSLDRRQRRPTRGGIAAMTILTAGPEEPRLASTPARPAPASKGSPLANSNSACIVCIGLEAALFMPASHPPSYGEHVSRDGNAICPGLLVAT